MNDLYRFAGLLSLATWVLILGVSCSNLSNYSDTTVERIRKETDEVLATCERVICDHASVNAITRNYQGDRFDHWLAWCGLDEGLTVRRVE